MLVYHFLPAHHALDDLRNHRLKIARLDEINDPFELTAATLPSREDRIAFEAYKQDMARNFGILCFSRNWRNPVLWSHYAQKHTGICLGFEVLDSLLIDIIYTETRLVLAHGTTLLPGDLNPQVAQRLLSMKFRDWSYEDEVRVFARLEEEDPVTGLYFREFDENMHLAQVIAGHRCTTKRSEILHALGRLEAVDVIKARLAFKSFWVVRNRRGFGDG